MEPVSVGTPVGQGSCYNFKATNNTAHTVYVAFATNGVNNQGGVPFTGAFTAPILLKPGQVSDWLGPDGICASSISAVDVILLTAARYNSYTA